MWIWGEDGETNGQREGKPACVAAGEARQAERPRKRSPGLKDRQEPGSRDSRIRH